MTKGVTLVFTLATILATIISGVFNNPGIIFGWLSGVGVTLFILFIAEDT